MISCNITANYNAKKRGTVKNTLPQKVRHYLGQCIFNSLSFIFSIQNLMFISKKITDYILSGTSIPKIRIPDLSTFAVTQLRFNLCCLSASSSSFTIGGIS
ncbi:hypothetical protein ABIB30_005297 [Pedobacter sp. UYP1]